MNKRQQAAFAQWAKEATDQITSRRPDVSGRLDWDTLKHFFYTGVAPGEAATRYLSNVAPRKD